MNAGLHYLKIIISKSSVNPLRRNSTELPTLQIAFQYTVVVPPDELALSQSSPTNRYVYVSLDTGISYVLHMRFL